MPPDFKEWVTFANETGSFISDKDFVNSMHSAMAEAFAVPKDQKKETLWGQKIRFKNVSARTEQQIII